MTNIHFSGPHSQDAVEWCLDNLKEKDWEMQLIHFAPARFLFKFKTREAATMFSLRWAEYA